MRESGGMSVSSRSGSRSTSAVAFWAFLGRSSCFTCGLRIACRIWSRLPRDALGIY